MHDYGDNDDDDDDDGDDGDDGHDDDDVFPEETFFLYDLFPLYFPLCYKSLSSANCPMDIIM